MLIIPDTHGRRFWIGPARENLGKEHIIFLGDYLDPYEYERVDDGIEFPRLQEAVAMKKKYPDMVTLLLGNHDLHYLDYGLLGGRYNIFSAERNRKFFTDNVDCFQMAFQTVVAGRKYLFTHAGVLRGWLNAHKDVFGDNPDNEVAGTLNEFWQDRSLWDILFSILKEIPYSRYGNYRYGSPIWSDVNDMSDNGCEVADTFQIFGHSQQEYRPIIRDHYACLDCRQVFRLTPTDDLEKYDSLS